MERAEQQHRLGLGAGSLVCLVSTVNSQLLVVKPRGKPGWNSGYELKTVPYQGSTQGDFPLESLPIDSVFLLLRNGERMGFKALGADGRTIQASEALNEPPRVYNHNFGPWESWEEVGDELVNSQWKHKKLGFRVRLVLAVAGESVARWDLQHKREVMRLQKQLDKLGGAAMIGQGMPAWEARESEALRRQLAEVQHSLEHWKEEAEARQAALEELQQQQRQQQRGQLQASFAGMGLPSQTAATISGLKADLREAQAKHAAQLAELQMRHEQQLQALRQERSEMVSNLLEKQRERHAGPAAPAAAEVAALEQQVETLQRRLDMAAAERDAAVGEVRAEMQAALHAKDEEYHRMLMAKDSEIYWHVEERQRLDLALRTIKDMTSLVRTPSPATADGTEPSSQPAQQPAQQQQQQQQGSVSRGGTSPAPVPSPLGQLPGLTVLGVPVPDARPASQGSPPEAEASHGSNAATGSADGPSGAVSIAAEVPLGVPQEQQAAKTAAALASGSSARPAEQWGLPVEMERTTAGGSRGAAGVARGSGGRQEKHSSELRCSLPAPAPESGGPSPTVGTHHLQPWEVQGAMDLGSMPASEAEGVGDVVASSRRPMGPPPPRRQQQQQQQRPGSAASYAPHSSESARRPLAHHTQPLKPHSAAAIPPIPESSVASPEHTGGAVDWRERSVHPAPALQSGASNGRLGRGDTSSVRPSRAAAVQGVGKSSGGANWWEPPVSPVAPTHPVFNAEVRSRISTLYDMLNPFRPSSLASTPRHPAEDAAAVQRREADLIRVAHLRGAGSSYPGGGVGPGRADHRQQQEESSDGGSMHRVPIGGSYLVDYNGAPPESITEEAMARILDAPLAPPDSARGRAPRWMQHQVDDDDVPSTAAHHASSAPASVATSPNASPVLPRRGSEWPTGSLSLPGSTGNTPLRPGQEGWEGQQALGALGNLTKEQVAARRNRGGASGSTAAVLRPTEVVKALDELSPDGANAVAQVLADRLTLRASMPENGWQAAASRKASRQLNLVIEGSEEGTPRKESANPLRSSAPAAPLSKGWEEEVAPVPKRQNPLRRSSFLQRPPVQRDALYGALL